MDKDELIRNLESEWSALLQSFRGLPEDRATESGAVGAWSVKDILGHITTWEEFTTGNLGRAMNGQPAEEYEEYETYNQEEVARKAGLSFAEIQRQLEEVHGKLMAALAGLPDQRWDAGPDIQEHVGEETYDHYREHYEQIREWRRVHAV